MFRRNPYQLRGRRLFYAGAIGTEPAMADVIVDQVRAFADKEKVAKTGFSPDNGPSGSP